MVIYKRLRAWGLGLTVAGIAAALMTGPRAASADFVTLIPASSASVDQQQTNLGSVYAAGPTDRTVGFGQPRIVFNTYVTQMSFDLSNVTGTVTGLELKGSLSLAPVPFTPPNFYQSGQYVDLGVVVTLPTTVTTNDPLFNLFAGVTNGLNVGQFTVDNAGTAGVTPPGGGTGFGQNFDVVLDPNALGAIKNGTLSLGFDPGPGGPINPGVQGSLALQLVVQTVPEPTALTLTGLGLALLGFTGFRSLRSEG
jgi:hypothetical protein